MKEIICSIMAVFFVLLLNGYIIHLLPIPQDYKWWVPAGVVGVCIVTLLEWALIAGTIDYLWSEIVK